jgi:magnesium transporter
MRKIAAWAGIATVWTAIAGIYGMNFKVMPELDWPYGYGFALTLMALVATGIVLWFRAKRWL